MKDASIEANSNKSAINPVKDEVAKRYDKKLIVSATGGFDQKVFVVTCGRRRHVGSWELVRAYGFNQNSLERLDDAEIDALPLGPILGRPVSDTEIENPSMAASPDEMRQIISSVCQGTGYEFGAGPRPMLIPLEATVKYCDRFTYEQTKDGSYSQFRSNFEGFMDIDVIDSLDTMSTIPDGSSDFLLAAHVIEHVRDPLGVLINSYTKLKPGGHLVLVIPDRFKTFDGPRPITTLDHLIADHLLPSRDRDLEHYIEWNRLVLKTVSFESAGRAEFDRVKDIHYHTFTYESFAQIVQYLQPATPWNRVWSHRTRDFPGALEFYFVFRK